LANLRNYADFFCLIKYRRVEKNFDLVFLNADYYEFYDARFT